jgi:maltodextrin utilization protein YvdJ
MKAPTQNRLELLNGKRNIINKKDKIQWKILTYIYIFIVNVSKTPISIRIKDQIIFDLVTKIGNIFGLLHAFCKLTKQHMHRTNKNCY